MWKNYALIDAKEFSHLIQKHLKSNDINFIASVENNGSNFYNDGLDFYNMAFDNQEIKLIPVQADPLSRFTRKLLFSSKYYDSVTFIALKNPKCKVTMCILKEIYQNDKKIANITQSERFRFAFMLKFLNRLRWERVG